MKPPHARRIAVASCAIATVAPLAVSTASAPVAADTATADDTPKSLVIGVDGAMYDQWDALDLPTFERLKAAGTSSQFNLFAQPMSPTVSGPAWSTIATGVWPDKHGVVDNEFTDPNYEEYPDYMGRIEAADPDASTLVVGTWSPVPDTIMTGADVHVPGGSDAGTTRTVIEHLSAGAPDATFVHLDEVDGAGHSCGYDCADYRDELTEVDGQIGQMLAAVEARESYADEDWQIILTADHGHTATGGHGGNTPEERQDFLIATGAGIPAGALRHDAKITDIAPTAMAHVGVDPEREWDLDGAPLAKIDADDFDPLRPALRTAVDETVPGTGWTQAAPSGWTIDNSAMPAGGVTEWRGWSFTTDEFWTNTQRGQGRETSVRNRDVFAVADSDEWDDGFHDPGEFDSTLVSPEYQVRGRAPMRVSYATNYQVDGPQTGEVYAVWDGAEPTLVKAYGSEESDSTNTVEQLRLTPPRGAETLQLRFRYTGTNSAFWTVDQVKVDRHR